MANVRSDRATTLAAWRPTLFADGEPELDATFARLVRTELADEAWIDHQSSWIRGSATIFERLAAALPWDRPTVTMYGRRLDQPRLSSRWPGPILDAVAGPFIEDCADALTERYGIDLHHVGANLYRDGADSVAWHGDRVGRDLTVALVAIVSFGEPRPFRLRPANGGPSRCWSLGDGDLLVMGGTCQRTWQHSVPKVRRTGPRLSVTFRHVPQGQTY